MYSLYLDLNGTILLCMILLFVCDALLRIPLYSIIARMGKRHDKSGLMLDTPPISVIILSRGDADELRRLLTRVFEQSYPAFEVVVVDDGRNPEVAEMIKKWEVNDKHLRLTFTPDNMRTIVRRKLSLTLGVRAARHDWVVVTQSDCMPTSADWLRAFATHIRENTDIVLGYANYHTDHYEDVPLHIVYDRMRFNMQAFLSASRNHPIAGDYTNMAFRKSMFLENDGFKGSLYLTGGEGITLVGEMADRQNTEVACEEGIKVEQKYESADESAAERYAQLEALQHSSGMARMYYYRNGLMAWTNILLLLVCVLYIIVRAIKIVSMGAYHTEDLQFDIIALAVILTKPILYAHYFNQSAALVKAPTMTFSLPFLELLIPLRTLIYKNRRERYEERFEATEENFTANN